MAGQLSFKLEPEVVCRIRVSKRLLEQNTRKIKFRNISPAKDTILVVSSFLRCRVEWRWKDMKRQQLVTER